MSQSKFLEPFLYSLTFTTLMISSKLMVPSTNYTLMIPKVKFKLIYPIAYSKISPWTSNRHFNFRMSKSARLTTTPSLLTLRCSLSQ